MADEPAVQHGFVEHKNKSKIFNSFFYPINRIVLNPKPLRIERILKGEPESQLKSAMV
jgi:hypothetical protein